MRTINSNILILTLSLLIPVTGAFANEPSSDAIVKVAPKASPSWFTLATLKKGVLLGAKVATVVALYNPSLVASSLVWAMPYMSSMVAASPYFALALTALKATEFLNPESPKMILLLKVLDVAGYGDYLRGIQNVRQSAALLNSAAAV